MSSQGIHLVDCWVDLAAAQIHLSGRVESLTPLELRLIKCLVSAPNHTASAEHLYREVWGYRSKPKGRALSFCVWRLRQKMEPWPADPRNLVTVHGVGFGLGLEKDQPFPSEQIERVVGLDGWLPQDAFIGRDAVLAQLEALVSAADGTVTVCGPGGIGKTRLVLHWLNRRGARVGVDSIVYCSLIEARTGQDMVQTVAQQLGVRAADGLDWQQTIGNLGQVLADRGNTLLVLDNLEQVAGAADILAVWKRMALEARFLLTSRSPLHVDNERVIRPGSLEVDEATELFRERLREQGKSIGTDPEEEALLKEIVGELDGSALAIELAAARAWTWPLHVIRDRLKNQLDLLRHRRKDLHPRQLSMRDTLAWSWGLLSDDEKDALVQCAAFRGPFSLDAFAHVVVPDADPETVLEGVGSLVDTAMVCLRHLAGEARVTLSPAVSAFVVEQLTEDKTRSALLRQARDRHLAWYAEITPVRQTRTLMRITSKKLFRNLETHWPQLQAAVEWALSSGQTGMAVRLGLVLVSLWRLRGQTRLAWELISKLLDFDDLTDVDRGWVQFWCALLQLNRGDFSASEEGYRQARHCGLAVGDERLTGMASIGIARIRSFQGRMDEVPDLIAGPLRQSHPGVAGAARLVQGQRALQLQQWDETERLYGEAMALFLRDGDEVSVFDLGIKLAWLEGQRGNWRGAKDQYEALLPQVSDRVFQVYNVNLRIHLGNCELQLGELKEAANRLEEAEVLDRQSGTAMGGLIMKLRGLVAELGGDEAMAEGLYRKAVLWALDKNTPLAEPSFRIRLGALLLRQGRLGEARTELLAAENLAEAHSQLGERCRLQPLLGLTERLLGMLEGDPRIRDGLSDLKDRVMPVDCAVVVTTLGIAEALHGDEDQARYWLAQAHAIVQTQPGSKTFEVRHRLQALEVLLGAARH